MLRNDIEFVLNEPPESSPGGWFQVIALDDSCEECRSLERFKFSREDLAYLIAEGDAPELPDCWCGLAYFFPDHGRLVPDQPHRQVRLADLRKNPDGSYDLSGLTKSELDLIWEESNQGKDDDPAA